MKTPVTIRALIDERARQFPDKPFLLAPVEDDAASDTPARASRLANFATNASRSRRVSAMQACVPATSFRSTWATVSRPRPCCSRRCTAATSRIR